MAGQNGETKFKLHLRRNYKVQQLKLRAKVKPTIYLIFLGGNLSAVCLLFFVLFTFFSGAEQDEEALIIPTAETVKQNYFLDLALANCIPLGNTIILTQ